MTGPRSVLDFLDGRLGDGLESVLRAHHRRRLRRLGWGDLPAGSDDTLFAAERPVRQGNSIELLIEAKRRRSIARQTRLRLWSEHLQQPLAEISGDPAEVVDGMWRPIAGTQAARARAGAPPTHRLTQLPGISSRTRRLIGPIRGLLVDG